MVCEEIKTSFIAKVAGTTSERRCYHLLNGFAFVAFLLALVGVLIKAKDPITEVETEALDVFPWPVLFFCYFDKDPENPADQSMEERIGLDLKPTHDCADGQAVVYTMDLGSDASAAPKRTCIDIKNRDKSDLSKDLEKLFRTMSKSVDHPKGRAWQCATINEDGLLASSGHTFKEIHLDWHTNLSPGAGDEELLFTWSGTLDPKYKTVAEQKDSFSYFTIPFVNSYSELFFTVDKHVVKDWTNMFTSSAVGERAKVLGESAMEDEVTKYLKDDAVTMKYSPSLNTKAMSPLTFEGREQKSRLIFRPLNYVSRTVTTRYQTWDEIWTGIGGAWATAALLIAIFFVQKQVQVPSKIKGTTCCFGDAAQKDPEVMEEVQVFRLRGATSKEEAVKTLFAMGVDAFDAGKANKDAVEGAVV